MNREQIHKAFKNYDEAFNALTKRLMNLGKAADKMYLDQLTSHMMWDTLMALLVKKGILAPGEFDEALKALAEATNKAMQEEAQKKAEALNQSPPAPAVPAPVIITH
jgi:prefoldin subunit 5